MDIDASLPSPTSAETWREIENLLEEIAASARSNLDESAFQQLLLARTARAIGADGGHLWHIAGQSYQLDAIFAGDRGDHTSPAIGQSQRMRRLEAARRARTPQFLSDSASSNAAEQKTADGVVWLAESEPTESEVVYCPLEFDGDVYSVLEFWMPALLNLDARENTRRILAAVAEIAADYHRGQQVHRMRRQAGVARQLERLVSRIHRSLDVTATAYEIVNEARQFIGCDRVSIARRRGGQCEICAVSGMATTERRSRTIASLEKLATLATRTGEPWWYGNATELKPESAPELQAHVDDTHARVVAILPLAPQVDDDSKSPPPVFGAFIIEHFSAELDDQFRFRTEVAAAQSGLALHNSLIHERVPFRRMWRGLSTLTDRDHRATWLWSSGVLLALTLALVLIPVEFRIEARGTLQPSRLQNVFAPVDGEIVEVNVEHDAPVKREARLLTLRSTSLELEQRKLVGERAATRERLLAVESQRILGRSSRDFTAGQLSATAEELRVLLDSQEQQLQLIDSQLAALEIPSPITGRVLTWDVEELLNGRPVSRGQLLLRVADVNGPWELRLLVRDHDIGHVLRAEQGSSDRLPVVFALATDPGVPYQGTVQRVAKTTTLDQNRQPVVEVIVQFDRTAVNELRPGADAIGKIQCGKRSLGYVWLREVMEVLQARFFF